MDTYLLDTNIVSADLNTRHPRHREVREALARLSPNTRTLISVITVGEMEFGLELADQNGAHLVELETILSNVRQRDLLSPTRHTAYQYGQIKTALAKKYCPKKSRFGRKRLPRWPQNWLDEVTNELLQVDDNDLWIAAEAVTQNLVLLTTDPDFRRIQNAVPNLRLHFI